MDRSSIRRLQAFIAILVFGLISVSAQAQTAFTYQGQLVNQGVAAEGLHDFSFELYDAAVDGSVRAASVVVEDVLVSNGLFTTQIDFGAVFDGTPVWMEIGVRPGSDTGAFTTLSPRQPITPSPMAMEADSLDGLDAADFASAAQVGALLSQLNTLQAEIGILQDQLLAQQEEIDALQNPRVLGRSASSSNGRISFGGRTGMAAANAMCESTFAAEPTAHACTLHEIQRAVADGNVAAGADGVQAWLVGPVVRGASFNSLLSNSCQGLMYNSAEFARGTRVQIDLGYTSIGNGGGITGNVVDLQSDISCGQNMPVLCCR